MAPTIEKISAITFRVLNMKASVQFYRNVLGMDLSTAGNGRDSLHWGERFRIGDPQPRTR
jgi:catechol 2,3-dioxygenase-like lactoylglutathione lyase family enzyme